MKMEDLFITSEEAALFVQDGRIPYSKDHDFFRANEGVILKDQSKHFLARYEKRTNELVKLNETPIFKRPAFCPKNKEQILLWDAFLNDNIDLIVIEGGAGTGKTFVSMLFGLYFVKEKAKYDSIFITRAPVEVGRSLGFLPGEASTKLDPYMQGFYDNVRQISPFSRKDQQQDDDRKPGDDIIETCALGFLRGRSLRKKFFVVDEAQNLTPHEIKTILTRVCDDCKVIVLGDPSQKDVKGNDRDAITYLKEKFDDIDFVQFVRMDDTKVLRGRLAKVSVERL